MGSQSTLQRQLRRQIKKKKTFIPEYQKLSWSWSLLCSNAEGFLCMHTNCVGVFREIDSVTHKKGASMYTLFVRPMQLSHKTTEALIDSSASKTFHE
jgi:hypothetical protein